MSDFKGKRIEARPNENINILLARFKVTCEKEGVFNEIKKREAFYPASFIKHVRKQKVRHLRKMAKIKEKKILAEKSMGIFKIRY